MLKHKRWRCLLLWPLFGFLPPAQADTGSALSIVGGVEHFRWREFDTDKRRLLEESGLRHGAGVNYDNLRRPDSGQLYGFGGRLYLGEVDYDGETQITRIPVSSTTRYIGTQADVMGGYRFARQSHALDVFAGAGLDFWARSIDDSFVPGLGAVSGGDEDYYTVYTKLGVGYFHELGQARHFLQLGVKYPVHVYEYAYQTGADDLVLRPKGRASWFAKYQWEFGGLRRNRWGLALYYDSYRFSQSNEKIERRDGVPTGFVVWQPESHQDAYGLQVSFYFP